MDTFLSHFDKRKAAAAEVELPPLILSLEGAEALDIARVIVNDKAIARRKIATSDVVMSDKLINNDKGQISDNRDRSILPVPVTRTRVADKVSSATRLHTSPDKALIMV